MSRADRGRVAVVLLFLATLLLCMVCDLGGVW